MFSDREQVRYGLAGSSCRKKLGAMLVLSLFLTVLSAVPAQAYTAYNNGQYGLYIDINKAPYNEDWSIVPYGPRSCTWFAQARVKDLTGICNGHIVYGCEQWYTSYGPSKGLATGKILRRDCKSLICWSSHIAVVEGFTPDGKIIISEGGVTSFYNGSETVPVNQSTYGHCMIRQMNSQSELENKDSGFLGYVYLPVPAMGFDGELSVSANVRGNSVDVYWTMTEGAVSHDLHIDKIGGTYTYDVSYGKYYFTHFQFSEGNYRATVTASYADGTKKTVQTEFSVGRLGLKAASRGAFADLSWNDIGADSYWVLAVHKESGKEVYSSSVGNATSTSLKLSDGTYNVYVTAIVDGQNVKTESAAVTTDGSLYVKADTKGTLVDISWNDVGADSYWVLIMNKATGAEVYSASVGKKTAEHFQFAEGEYNVYITPTTNGVNGKTGSASFTCDASIYVDVEVFDRQVDVSWNDIGADSYWALVTNKATGA